MPKQTRPLRPSELVEKMGFLIVDSRDCVRQGSQSDTRKQFEEYGRQLDNYFESSKGKTSKEIIPEQNPNRGTAPFGGLNRSSTYGK